MSEEIQKSEAEYAAFVDQGTRAVLQEAIQKIVETFAQTDALEDTLSYLEEMRETLQRSDDRIKEVQQREKQINDRIAAAETSVRTLLQRMQEMEVQLASATDQIEEFLEYLVKLAAFFEQPPLKRLFGRLQLEPKLDESAEM